jgi:heme-degrading monooxygenase HmoA
LFPLTVRSRQLGAHLGLRGSTDGLIDQEVFESIYHPGKLLLLAGWRDAAAAKAWTPTKPDTAAALRHRHVRGIRDYGMFDRGEAPQFYAEVSRNAARSTEAEPRRRAAAS